MSKEKPINISWGEAIATSKRWKSYPQSDLSEQMKEFMESFDRLIDRRVETGFKDPQEQEEIKEALRRMHMAEEKWKAGGSKSVSKKRDKKKRRGKLAQQWWESEFKGRVTAADQRVAEVFDVDPRTVANWRVHWKRGGWKQPTKSDIR